MNDKILLVTGASSDIASVLIDSVANNYSKVIAHYCHSNDQIEKIVQKYGDKIFPIQADFSDANNTKSMIDKIMQRGLYPDHIVHISSGKVSNLQFHKQPWERYEKEINISIRSIVMICQQLIPFMVKKKHGKIVFMLSAYVFGIPPKFESSYITTKYGLLGLMKSLSAEYSSKNITVNAVSPEMMETKFLTALPELILEQSAKNNPLGRNILVEEAVPTIEFLLSDSCNAVTGQNIGVTGGAR